jgi:hypothetical protein
VKVRRVQVDVEEPRNIPWGYAPQWHRTRGVVHNHLRDILGSINGKIRDDLMWRA